MKSNEFDRLFRSMMGDDRFPHVIDYLKGGEGFSPDIGVWRFREGCETIESEVERFLKDYNLGSLETMKKSYQDRLRGSGLCQGVEA